MSLFVSFLKKLFLVGGIVILSYSYAYAAPQFSATTSGPTINGVLSGVTVADTGILMFYQTTPFALIDAGGSPTAANSISGLPDLIHGSVSFHIDAKGNTKYYVRAVATIDGKRFISPSVEVTTGDEVKAIKMTYDKPSDCRSIYINAGVTNSNRSDYIMYLQYRNTDEEKNNSDYHKADPIHGKEGNAAPGIAADGTYSFYLKDLIPKTKYYVINTVAVKATGKVLYTEKGDFNSCDGHIASGAATTADVNKRSYRFLAPITIPGLGIDLQFLPDQDLCREQEAEGLVSPGSCENQIGDFVNLILRILISFAAIVLVIKLIIEGYSYMVTDTPFRKASAKTQILESFGGLLLALSSYLILNTINPKLVSGGLNIGKLDIGVIKSFDLSGVFISSFNGKPISINFNKEAYPAAKIA